MGAPNIKTREVYIKMGNNCKNCNNTCNRIYCSNKCQITFQRIQKIQLGKADLRTVKKFLLERQGNICSICELSEWLGQKLPLVADHIDGNPENNSLDNIRLICNNCDSLLPTFKARNKGSGRTIRKRAGIV